MKKITNLMASEIFKIYSTTKVPLYRLSPKFILFFIVSLSLASCVGHSSKNRNNTTGNNQDSTAIVYVRSELGLPISVRSNKQSIRIFEGEDPKTVDTVRIEVYPIDLLIVGETQYTAILDSILIRPQDCIEVVIGENGISSYFVNNGEKQNASWSTDKLLNRGELSSHIREYKDFFYKVSPPPPPRMGSSAKEMKIYNEITKVIYKERKDSINLKKRDFYKTNYSYYFNKIVSFYDNALQNIPLEDDESLNKFNTSYIFKQYFDDLWKLNAYVKQDEIYDKMHHLCDLSIDIESPFADNMFNTYYTHRYSGGKKIPLTTVYDSIIPLEFKTQQKKFRQSILKDMEFFRYSKKDIQTYTDKFIAQYGTNKFIDDLRKRNGSAYSELTTAAPFYPDSSDILLEDTKGNTLSFEDLRREYKGNVLYVDFWASWCSPCRWLLPSSKKLKNELNGKDIVFIYLAYDDPVDKWKKACEKEDLFENSYRITNTKESKYLKALGIKSVSHFLIYDKQGMIYSDNAQEPNDAHLKEELSHLLK